MALTNKEKQQALRDRRAKEGLTEIRGIYAAPDDHTKIKAYAKKLRNKSKKS